MSTTNTRRRAPALSVNYMADFSGGTASDVIQSVTPFNEGGSVADPDSARHAFGKVIVAAAEIIAKVAPDVALPFADPAGEVPSLGSPVEGHVAMPVVEANMHRVVANSAIYTASVLVSRFAVEKGLNVPYRNAVTGEYLVDGGAFVVPSVSALNSQRNGLTKADLDAALQRWADALATMATVVNAAPEPASAPVEVSSAQSA